MKKQTNLYEYKWNFARQEIPQTLQFAEVEASVIKFPACSVGLSKHTRRGPEDPQHQWPGRNPTGLPWDGTGWGGWLENWGFFLRLHFVFISTRYTDLNTSFKYQAYINPRCVYSGISTLAVKRMYQLGLQRSLCDSPYLYRAHSLRIALSEPQFPLW